VIAQPEPRHALEDLGRDPPRVRVAAEAELHLGEAAEHLKEIGVLAEGLPRHGLEAIGEAIAAGDLLLLQPEAHRGQHAPGDGHGRRFRAPAAATRSSSSSQRACRAARSEPGRWSIGSRLASARASSGFWVESALDPEPEHHEQVLRGRRRLRPRRRRARLRVVEQDARRRRILVARGRRRAPRAAQLRLGLLRLPGREVGAADPRAHRGFLGRGVPQPATDRRGHRVEHLAQRRRALARAGIANSSRNSKYCPQRGLAQQLARVASVGRERGIARVPRREHPPRRAGDPGAQAGDHQRRGQDRPAVTAHEHRGAV
jgi:hypothetical protein